MIYLAAARRITSVRNPDMSERTAGPQDPDLGGTCLNGLPVYPGVVPLEQSVSRRPPHIPDFGAASFLSLKLEF